MKQTIYLFILLTVSSLSAQISFQKGYFINNIGDKKECLIKNIDWKNNPKSFSYKLSNDSDIETMLIPYVKEFGIYNNSKYLRAKVDIDQSGSYTSSMSQNRNPEYISDTVFLKVLTEGEAHLYYI